MNIIKKVSDRITDRMTETKNPCKSFKTEAAAEKAAQKMSLTEQELREERAAISHLLRRLL